MNTGFHRRGVYEGTTDTKFDAAVSGSIYLGSGVCCAECGNGSCGTIHLQLQQIRAGIFLFVTIFDFAKAVENQSRGA